MIRLLCVALAALSVHVQSSAAPAGNPILEIRNVLTIPGHPNPGKPLSFARFHRFQDAAAACPVGTRLPTAREFAQAWQDYGEEFWEPSSNGPSQPPQSLLEVRTRRPDGTREVFFYSRARYHHPVWNGPLSNMWFWTASNQENVNAPLWVDARYGTLLGPSNGWSLSPFALCIPKE